MGRKAPRAPRKRGARFLSIESTASTPSTPPAVVITFPRAPRVAPGDPVSSAHLAGLAHAINARLRSGLGDGPWRIAWYWLQAARQIRNSNGALLFPSNAEYFEYYAHLDPTAGEWPLTGPGDPEGTNVASLAGEFVFGSEGRDLYSEAARLSDPAAGGLYLETDLDGLPAPATVATFRWTGSANWGWSVINPSGLVVFDVPTASTSGSYSLPDWTGYRVRFNGRLFGEYYFADPPCGNKRWNWSATVNVISFGAGAIISTSCDGAPSVPCYPGQTPIGHAWLVGRLQRGAYDATTSTLAAPAFKAAREHLRIVNSNRSPHGNSYGGFLPVPEYLGACSDGTTDTEPTPNYELKFTALREGLSDRIYPGTCPDDPSHVAAVYYLPDRYLVLLWGGTVEELLTRDYLEGPYTGGRRLRKTWGDHLKRILNFYTAQYRGTEAQRKTAAGAYQPDAPEYAFDVQRFLTSQYRLAPARGTLVSSTEVSDTPGYQTFTLSTGRYAAGRTLGTVTAEPGYCVAGWYVIGCTLDTEVAIEAVADGAVVSRARVSAAQPEAVVWLDTPVPAGTPVTFRLANDVAVLASGFLSVESAELLAYQPHLHDLYLTLRLGGARTELLAGTDGYGLQEDGARQISDLYFDAGVLHSVHGSGGLPEPFVEINSNGVMEALRRFSRHVRILRPQQLVGYAVEGGKSVLWIDPIVYGTRAANCLAGITDAIAHDAPPGGFTNEWLLDLQLKPYAVPDSSIWKRETYADFWAFSDRCLFYHPTFPIPPAQASNHFAFGSKLWAPAEAPSGYRYATFPAEGRILNSTATADFYRSCRIYEPPLEIDRAESVTIDGRALVKVTLTGRLHHHTSAPASIDRDVTTWNLANLRAESYRTAENALREYLVNQTLGNNCVGATQEGNAAASSDVWTTYSNLHGACIPHILLVQLIPRPYRDANAAPDASDSPMEHDPFPQVELYLRAMCEGYVDGRITEENGCATGIDAIFDYTFQNVCFDAFGGRWINPIGTQPTDHTPDGSTRPDNPEGHGPIPSTYPYSQVFNQLAAVVDKLTRVRVMLPFQFEAQRWTGETTAAVAGVVDSDNLGTACAGIPSEGVFWKGSPPDAQATTLFSGWATVPFATSRVEAAFGDTGSGFSCSGSDWTVRTFRSTDEYRWALVDPDAEEALPPTIRDMLASAGQFLAIVTRTIDAQGIEETNLAGADTCGGLAAWTQTDGDYLRFPDRSRTETTCEIVPAYARLEAPRLGPSVITGAPNGLGGYCNTGVQNDITLTPVVTDALILTVPLTPAEE